MLKISKRLLVQGLMIIAYAPTVKRLWYSDRNTESFAIWGAFFGSSLLGLYLAVSGKDWLATAYVARALVSVAIVLFLMIRLELRARRMRGFGPGSKN